MTDVLRTVLLRFDPNADDAAGENRLRGQISAVVQAEGHLWVASDESNSVEGLAVRGNRAFLGLRGPVLGGWAVVIEILLEDIAPGFIRLAAIDDDGRQYRKHFLDLRGLGLRDLCSMALTCSCSRAPPWISTAPLPSVAGQAPWTPRGRRCWRALSYPRWQRFPGPERRT